jgi:hypothetical protein
MREKRFACLQLKSAVIVPREAARAMPNPVALLGLSDSKLWMVWSKLNQSTYIKPRLINAHTEIFVFSGSCTLHMTKTGSREHSRSVTIENASGRGSALIFLVLDTERVYQW